MSREADWWELMLFEVTTIFPLESTFRGRKEDMMSWEGEDGEVVERGD